MQELKRSIPRHLDPPIVLRPKIGLKMYWPECCLLASLATIPLFLASLNYLTLGRAGGFMVLGTIFAQLIALNRANSKHIDNAIRVKLGKQPLDFSAASRLFGQTSLVLALVGLSLTPL